MAAASVVQRAVRAWRLRRGLERFGALRQRALAAVVHLQALWRARPVYRQYKQLRQAAICVQVGDSADLHLAEVHVAQQADCREAWPLQRELPTMCACCMTTGCLPRQDGAAAGVPLCDCTPHAGGWAALQAGDGGQ